MKKVIYILLLIAVAITTIAFGKDNKIKQINTFYDVSLKGEHIGVINSKDKLLGYIEENQNIIKQTYSVSSVSIPDDLQIQKIMTYDDNVDNIDEVYKKITEKSNFAIEGYKVSISGENGESQIYISNYDILEPAISSIIEMFVGEEEYSKYKNGTQKQIDKLGTYINSVYIDNNISVKKENISVNEKIYTDSATLSKFLLYGTEGYSKKYVTSIGDTISSIAFKNQISVKEFMMANSDIKNANILLYPGQEVTIGVIDPIIQVVVEKKVAEETVLNYQTVESVDENRVIGNNEIVQNGEDGVLKVVSNEKVINGNTVYVQPLSSEVLKPAVDKIIIKGGKKVSGVGSLSDWAWPLKVGRIITDPYGWRINPVTYRREMHAAIDLGAAYGTPIYAADNGIIEVRENTGSCGNEIQINHNNGYYTEYCHMSKFSDVVVGQAVEKGQLIGYVGMTGTATGPHLHFGVWYGRPWVGYSISPLSMYN